MILALVLVIAGGLLWWTSASETDVESGEGALSAASELSQATAAPATDEPSSAMMRVDGDSDADGETPAEKSEAAPETSSIRLNPDAVASLRRGREQGEPRTPPLVEDSPEREMPSDEELADPDMYLEYESRQKQKVLASFMQASEKKVSELRAAIERAEAEGVSEEQLAEGREKLERLEAMREEVLRDHPELAAPEEEDGQDSPASP